MHRDQRGGVQGVVRRRRAAGLLHRHRALRRDLPLRPQHARDPDRAVGADPGPHPRRGPAPHRVRRPAPHRGGRGGRAHRRGAPRPARRHQPGADERRSPASCSSTAGSTTTGSRRTPSASTTCARSVEPYTPEQVADICGVDPDDLRQAARIFGESEAVLSTVLQGFYQSHQATAASVAVHNLHLLRGMIGRPGAGVLQMNGQPTAQNNRECGADGDLPGFRNWDNPAHVQQLADLWNVDAMTDPALGAAHPRDADHVLRRDRLDRLPVDLGDQPGGLDARVRADPPDPRRRPVLRRRPGPVPHRDRASSPTWSCRPRAGARRPAASPTSTAPCTSPSRPSSHRARPAATSTSSWRTPTRWASPTRTATPLITWRTPEEVFDAWGEATRGRPVDYTGLATTSSAARRASRGRSTTSTPTAPTGSTPTASSPPTPTTARPTATTCSPAGPSPSRSTGRWRRRGARSSRAPPTLPRTRSRTTTTRCSTRPGAPSTSSTPAPRPAGPGRSTRPRPTPGSSSRPPTPSPSASTRATGSGSSRPRGAIEVRARVGRVMPGAVFAPFHYGHVGPRRARAGRRAPPRPTS